MVPNDDDGDEVETKPAAAPWARPAAPAAPPDAPMNTPPTAAEPQAPWARDLAKSNNASPVGAQARSEPNGRGAEQQAPWAGGGMPNWGAVGQGLGLLQPGGGPAPAAMQGPAGPQVPGRMGFRPGMMNPMAAQVAQALAARRAQLEQRGQGGPGGPMPVQRPPWGR